MLIAINPRMMFIASFADFLWSRGEGKGVVKSYHYNDIVSDRCCCRLTYAQ
jgi:hypothetical protein